RGRAHGEGVARGRACLTSPRADSGGDGVGSVPTPSPAPQAWFRGPGVGPAALQRIGRIGRSWRIASGNADGAGVAGMIATGRFDGAWIHARRTSENIISPAVP